MGTVRETLAESTEGAHQFGPKRSRVYSDLTFEEKDRYNADIQATNILLQGLPKDIYTLINHYTDAKDIWDNKGESIHDYYVRFAKLINNTRNIKMTMSRLQLNSKFVNNMLPEWGRFMTAVKLNRGLRDSNYDQLYAYLKQHETHAKENKMMLEHFSQPTVDPLALLSNVSHPQHYSPSSSASSSTQVPPPLADSSSSAKDLIKNLTNMLASPNHTKPSSLKPTINSEHLPIQGSKPQYKTAEWWFRMFRGDPIEGQVRPGQARTVKCYNCNGTSHVAWNCTQPKRPQNFEYYKDKMLLMQAQENRVALDAEQLLFLAGGHDNAFDDDVDEQSVQDLALNVENVFQADDCDAFDSDVDEAPTAQTMFMANLSSADPVTDEAGPSYNSDILSEYMIPYEQYVKDNEVPVVHSDASSVPTDAFMMIYNDMCESDDQSVSNPSWNTVVKNSLTAELATYKEHVELSQRADQGLQTNKGIYSVSSKYTCNACTQSASNKDSENPYFYTNSTFLEFDKICKKRITPTWLTEREMGFEQTKECYLKEVIPFFKTLKDNFEGIQKALTKEIKEMKYVFEELEAEVAQYAVDRKHDAIEWKNLLIANDNLIAECLFQEVFSVATNSKLNVARFTKMLIANTTVEARCLALEVELANLRDTNNLDNQKELINHFSKHEELLEYVIGTCPQGSQQRAKQLAYIPLIRKKQVVIANPSDKSDSTTHRHVVTIKSQQTNVPVPPSTGVNSCLNASGSQPKSNVKPNRISPAKGVNKLPVEDQTMTNKSHLRTSNHVDSNSRLKCTIVLWYLDSGCSKHMMGDRSWLMNFVKKFIETVRFVNDHFGAIMGYGDYVIGNSVISRVYYVEGIGHNLFSVGQFCDSDREVAFRKHSCYVRDIDGVELIKGSRESNLYTISIEDMMKSSPICLLSKASKNKSWLWHRRLNYLNFGTLNDLAKKDLVRGLPRLKFEKDHLYSACQLEKSKKHTHKPKAENTNLEVLNTLHVDLCGLMRVQTINGNKYILVIVDDYSRFTWVKFLRS
nr:retrovirus-related Pol polyprotein from transposon TNT 1-94 [Tanacetum cinerariifolium]